MTAPTWIPGWLPVVVCALLVLWALKDTRPRRRPPAAWWQAQGGRH